ncbi:DUF4263 domain-containing protein [Leptospira sp. FAT2]|uniref:Shedu anti-phage system protein SduA domain-containing protein n=1 Tax=Leptospira sanjuanensis TaxID=2879643 RepID=UPI001EE7DAF1|nr:Shedu anti-phage system protein SduA domain-containing protein [Leptospira sanjuanensis]MCG6195540.1 DUF4263 domain-containing protein [Leptospira sanjuanensis]
MIYKWSLLNSDKKILKKIKAEWNEHLKNKKLTEHDYHKFLSEHAGIILAPDDFSYMVLSKIKLADDYEVDFVTIEDMRSNGMCYNLIEIESPHSPPFTKAGKPSDRLTTALQQIDDWRFWIKENREKFKRLFPNEAYKVFKGHLNYSFTIYIGNRENSEPFLEKRNELAYERNVSIRSFDSLGDYIESNRFSDLAPDYAAEMTEFSDEIRNQLASPFFKATTHSKWKIFLKQRKGNAHIFTWNASTIVNLREYNKLYYDFLDKGISKNSIISRSVNKK